MNGKVWIGTSGYVYPHWRGDFYPPGLPQKKWFEYYCQVFNSLEINGSFYRYPRVNTLTAWYQKSPPDFDFSIKVPRFVTHFWKFRNVREKLADFYSVAAEGLREKLGCVLFQLHPATVFSEQMLDQILASIDPAFNNVIEFRHATWWKPEVVVLSLAVRNADFSILRRSVAARNDDTLVVSGRALEP